MKKIKKPEDLNVKIYKTLDELPIGRYVNFIKTNDFSWLVKDDKFELTENLINELLIIWESFKPEIKNVNLEIASNYYICYQLYFKYLKGEVHINTVHKQFGRYRESLNKNYDVFIYNSLSYSNVNDLYSDLLKQNGHEWSIENQINTFDFQKLGCKNQKEYDLFEECAQIEVVLGIQIDTNICPVKKYWAYQKIAKEKVKKQQNTNGKDIRI